MAGGKSRPRVAVTRRLPAPVEARMRDLFELRLNEDDRRLGRSELLALMQENDVLVRPSPTGSTPTCWPGPVIG